MSAERRDARRAVEAIRSEIARVEGSLASSLAAAEGALDASRAYRSKSAQDLQGQVRQVVAADPYAYLAWNADLWDDWTCEPSHMAEVRVGELHAEGIPATVPVFDGSAVVVATESEAAAERARELLRSVAVRCAVALGDRVVLHLLDPAHGGFEFPERRHLHQDAPAGGSVAESLSGIIDRADAFRDRHQGRTIDQLSEEELRSERVDVVIALDYPQGYDHAARTALSAVARLGPAGVQLFVHDRLEQAKGYAGHLDLDRVTALRLDASGGLSGAWGARTGTADGAPDEQLVRDLASRMPVSTPAQDTSLAWSDLNPDDEISWWQDSAATGLTAGVGTAIDGTALELHFGRSADGVAGSHAVIGGTTSSGKSVLMHAILLSLAARYSPAELRFFLLDGQKGVTMQDHKDLPHAELVAVNTPVDLARGVLMDIRVEMDRRDALLVDASVDAIDAYWSAHGPAEMPRLVVAIDEYQRLFDGDRKGETAAVLQAIAAQGRKVGIHLLLASQRFHATGLPNQAALFDNVGTRIALMLTDDAIAAVDEFGGRGRELIRSHATAPGRVVLNDRGGAESANRLGTVLHLTPPERKELVSRVINKAKSSGIESSAVIFHGSQQPRVGDNRALRELARVDPARGRQAVKAWAATAARSGGLAVSQWQVYDHPAPFIVGRAFSVHGSAFAKIDRRVDHNVMLIGHNAEVLTGMALCGIAAVGLAVKQGTLNVTVLSEFPVSEASWDRVLSEGLAVLLAHREHSVSAAETPAQAVALLDQAIDDLDRRIQLEAEAPNDLAMLGPHLVVALAAERVGPLTAVEGRYGAELSADGAKLARLVTEGPARGVHVVLGTGSRQDWQRILPGKEHRRFTHRFVQQMSEGDSRHLLDNHDGFRVMPPGAQGPDRAGYSRSDSPGMTVFLPYATADDPLEALTDFYRS